jgi:dUTP pyrophosphatase
MLPINFALLSANAHAPTQGKSDDAGYDLYSAVTIQISPQSMSLVGTGISMSIPPGWYGRVLPRSGFTINNISDIGAGVIDSGYIGEIKVVIFNHGIKPIDISPGDRIAQIVFMQCAKVNFTRVDSHSATQRGDAGFGSTGV